MIKYNFVIILHISSQDHVEELSIIMVSFCIFPQVAFSTCLLISIFFKLHSLLRHVMAYFVLKVMLSPNKLLKQINQQFTCSV